MICEIVNEIASFIFVVLPKVYLVVRVLNSM